MYSRIVSRKGGAMRRENGLSYWRRLNHACHGRREKEKQSPGKIKTKTDVSIFGNIPSPPWAIEKLGEKRGGGWGEELEFLLGGVQSLRGEAEGKGGCTVEQNQVILRHPKFTFPRARE